MIFIVRNSDHSVENQRRLRQWYFDNALLYSTITDPAVVDSAARTATVNMRVPIAGQEDQDFPEFVVDAQDQPITVERVMPLAVCPLGWMFTMTGAWTAGDAAEARLLAV
jgi:hypothetical protein